MCNKIIQGKYFCRDCDGKIAPIKIKTCLSCGQVLSKCSCKRNFYYFDEMVSCFEADENTKTTFYSFKFGGNFFGGKYFAEEMIKHIKKKLDYTDIDIITPVPSHKSAKQEKEYDTAEVLAKQISKALHIPFKRLIIQPKKVPKQHETEGFAERYNNVKGKYSVKKRANIKNKTILLVDDIKTSGATLSECARELKLSFAGKVIGVTALTVPLVKKES